MPTNSVFVFDTRIAMIYFIVFLIAFVVFILYSLAQILLAIFPMNALESTTYALHMFFAILLFFFFGVCAFLYTYLEYTIKSFPVYLKLIGLVTALLSLMTSIFIFLGHYTDLYDYNIFVYLLEWGALGSCASWIFLHSFYFYKSK